MADLNSLEKQKLENLLRMKQGFLLNFTDPSLQAFVHRSVGLDFYHEKYRNGTSSKANRMREFWKVESDFIVAKLIFDLCQYFKDLKERKGEALLQEEKRLLEDCLGISKRLSNSAEVVALLLKRKATDTQGSGLGRVEVVEEEEDTARLFSALSLETQVASRGNETVFLITNEDIMPFLKNMSFVS
ncbi:hypothetical protein [Rufibacter hautae]|uniref:Uncharacterized protein n=1 Tax=Rufibacter hautae TaxID=2595005 RepID=A0A5B6TQH3_9BACT|nr:hypothetical protein [Rufibacter hautae]KAA3438673.1 hypothetical protein FOA19_15740 [Rufibacter hautae]